MFKRAEVEIGGLTPMLMDRMDPNVLKSGITRRSKSIIADTEEQAKKSRYITNVDGKEYLCVETQAVHACIIKMARYYRVSKFRMDMLLAGNMKIEPTSGQTMEIHSGLSAIPLTKNGELVGAEDYEVDERPVKRKILKGRAKIWPWELKFYLVAEEELLTEERKRMEELISGAGTTLGLLSFAPRHGGSFGTFRLASFKVLES